ncbi:MAG: hypothetical protein ABI572_10815 [Actinomycetota bacterium]
MRLAHTAIRVAMTAALIVPVVITPVASARADTCAWTSISVPSPGTDSSTLLGVDVASSTDAWAVGWDASVETPDLRLPLAVHWDGSAWVETPMPAMEGLSTELSGVAAVAADQVWAVGTTRNPVTLRDRFIVYRWSGSEWTIVRRGPENGARSTLQAVSAAAPDDVWAVGFINDRTMTLHWDGQRWMRIASPNPGLRFNGLYGVTAVDAGRAWAVGDRRDQLDGSPLILRWNGVEWAVSSVPALRNVAGFRDVDATSRRDAWVVGFTGVKTLALHFDGTAWRKVNTPNPASSGNDLDGVTTVASDDVWAVGQRIDGEDPGRNLILHFDGTAWAEVAAPDPGVPNRLYDVDGSSATDLWSVGQARLAGIPSTQALQGCAPPPPPPAA